MVKALLVEQETRRIIHVDMDAFYASVEQRDRPELRGQPVIVGGSPKSRGVVCTASYEARSFGVRSAMPTSQAYRLCPQGIFLTPDFPRYSAVSAEIRRIFASVTDLVEPLSLDEAYLDVTDHLKSFSSATEVARHVRSEILSRTGLTASAGVAANKFLAKVASDFRKPNGLVVISPSRAASFLKTLPVSKIPGVGPVTNARLKEKGIATCGDVLGFRLEALEAAFGRLGHWLYAMARGDDPRSVEPDQPRKSLSIEDTLAVDEVGTEAAWKRLLKLMPALDARLRAAGVCGRTLVLKVKYADFRQITRSRTLLHPLRQSRDFLPELRELLEETQVETHAFRLLGVGLSNLVTGEEIQGLLPFPEITS